MPKMNGAQALVQQLEIERVNTVFALPGLQIMPAFDAIHAQGAKMRLVHTRHEQATTYMADGYARVTGEVGVAMVVPGPGALNAAAGLGTAYAASSPVLLISGQIPSTSLGKRRGELHEIDEQLEIFRGITKWNARIDHVEDIPGKVREAFRQLKSGRPRPVELEVPFDFLNATGDVELIEPGAAPAPACDQDAIAKAARIISGATRPAIISGGGAITAGASTALIELAEKLQAPIVTTQQGKGIIPETHPLHLGTDYYVSPLPDLVPECDVLIAIGTRLLLRGLTPDALPRLVQIDIDPSEIDKNYKADVGVVADAKQAVQQLLAQLGSLAPRNETYIETVADLRRRFKQRLRDLAPVQSEIIDAMRLVLDDDAVVVSGITNMGYWSTLAYPAITPRSFISSSYFGTLGYAFPTALGAKLAAPDKQVIALCGDGGFMFCVQELSTAVALGINAIAIVFNNNAYGASRWDQTHGFGERFIGTDLGNPDFCKLAEAFGALGLRTDPAGFGATLKQALNANAPVLLEVEVPVMMPPFQLV
jgi:acetolactate synthase-1/2/3 large subunit